MYAFSEHIEGVIRRNAACCKQGDEESLRPIGGETLLSDYGHIDSSTRLERRAQNDFLGVLPPR